MGSRKHDDAYALTVCSTWRGGWKTGWVVSPEADPDPPLADSEPEDEPLPPHAEPEPEALPIPLPEERIMKPPTLRLRPRSSAAAGANALEATTLGP